MKFIKGCLLDLLHNIISEARNLSIIDDMIGEKNGHISTCNHKKVISWESVHNFRYVEEKNTCDASQTIKLAKQIHHSRTKLLRQAYELAIL